MVSTLPGSPGVSLRGNASFQKSQIWAEIEPSAVLWFAGAGVFTAFVGRVFFYSSVEKLGAMRSSALKRLSPLFAVLLGVLVLGETLTGGAMGGTGITNSAAKEHRSFTWA